MIWIGGWRSTAYRRVKGEGRGAQQKRDGLARLQLEHRAKLWLARDKIHNGWRLALNAAASTCQRPNKHPRIVLRWLASCNFMAPKHKVWSTL